MFITVCCFSQSQSLMTVASRVRGTHRGRVCHHSMSCFLSHNEPLTQYFIFVLLREQVGYEYEKESTHPLHIKLYFCPVSVAEIVSKVNDNPNWVVVLFISVDLSDSHPGLRWAVCLSCLTREMGWAQEWETVQRMSLLPAPTSSSYWRNMATEMWASTVSGAHGSTLFFLNCFFLHSSWIRQLLSVHFFPSGTIRLSF